MSSSCGTLLYIKHCVLVYAGVVCVIYRRVMMNLALNFHCCCCYDFNIGSCNNRYVNVLLVVYSGSIYSSNELKLKVNY